MPLKDWTRRLLEDEARKHGVREPEAHSNTELMRGILRDAPRASAKGLRTARRFVGALFDVASAALPSSSHERPEPAPEPHWRPQPSAPSAPKPSAASPVPPPPSAAEPEQLALADDSRLEYTRREADGLHLRWQVSELGAARARALLGGPGELAIRVVSVRADDTLVVRSEVTEHGPVNRSGEWIAPLLGSDVHCVSAIGLRAAGRFVSIAHQRSQPRS